MGNIFNQDFLEFIEALNLFDVEYVLIGGYSVIIHGYNRTTGDLDIFVKSSDVNFQKIEKAFKYFGMALMDMTKEHFLNTDKFDVFTFGRPPVSIEILTKIKGPEFEEVYNTAFFHQLDNNIKVRTIHFNQLLSAKKAANRARDLDDIMHLQKIKNKDE